MQYRSAGAASSIPGSGRFSGGGCGNPLQYSCLENPMDRRTWQATVHRVAKSWTWLKQLSTNALILFLPLLIGNFLILSTSSVPTHALPALFTEYIFGTNIWNYSVNLSPSHQRFIISLPRCLVTPNSSSPIEMGAGNTSTAASHKTLRVLLLFPPTPSHSQLLGFAELALYTLSCIA